MNQTLTISLKSLIQVECIYRNINIIVLYTYLFYFLCFILLLLDEDSAQLFTIEYHNNYKLLTDVSTGSHFALVQCGTPAPANSSLPNGTEIYQVPIKNAAVLSTTVIPFLEVSLLKE